jgi:hypothetical protein
MKLEFSTHILVLVFLFYFSFLKKNINTLCTFNWSEMTSKIWIVDLV